MGLDKILSFAILAVAHLEVYTSHPKKAFIVKASHLFRLNRFLAVFILPISFFFDIITA